MPTIVKFSPVDPPEKTPVKANGRSLPHECTDASGKTHRQRLALGSVRGIFYLDAICLHCGAHFIWDDDDHDEPGA
jgi:Rieske Fe-S protein